MATVLIAWELGGGLGHLLPLEPLVRGLCERGHRVAVALRDLSRAGGVFGREGVAYFQAPLRLGRVADHIARPRTFAHILHNVGFADAEELRTRADAWRGLYECVRPELILFDHSPTALLVARGYRARRVVIGIPFACPPDESPLPALRAPVDGAKDDLRGDEQRVLQRVNKVLAGWHEPPLDWLSQLYHPADETLLTTFRELDCYPSRADARYWGVWPAAGGAEPVWPPGHGRKVYAYLKRFPALPNMLGLLRELGCPTLVYLDGHDEKLQRRYGSATLRFARRRPDPTLVGRRCDLAVLNAGHGMTASMLTSGKPVLQLPIYLEQTLTAEATVRLGAGLSARINRPEEIAVKLMAMLCGEEHSQAARGFAGRCAELDSERQVGNALQRIEQLLG